MYMYSGVTKNKTLIIFVLLLITFFAFKVIRDYYVNYVKPTHILQKTYFLNMSVITTGIFDFCRIEQKKPNSLSEVVNAGYLPEMSKVYYCLAKYNTLKDKEISYKGCEFEIVIDSNGFINICMPKEVFKVEPFKKLYSEERRCYQFPLPNVNNSEQLKTFKLPIE